MIRRTHKGASSFFVIPRRSSILRLNGAVKEAGKVVPYAAAFFRGSRTKKVRKSMVNRPKKAATAKVVR